jgi:hypothetical protein
MMLDNETSPALRVEIAALLREHHLLTADLLDRLTNLDQPAPIRLFAAELMLRINPHDPDGVDVLRGLARQPNRELSVRVAAVLQTVLGWDMGLPESGELPAPNSKEAADITRRVLAWANGVAGMTQDVLRPTPGPRAGLAGGSRHAMYGFGSRTSVPGLPTRPPSRMVIEESAMMPDHPAMLPDQSAMIPEQSAMPPERPAPPQPPEPPPTVRQAPPPVPTRRDVAPSRHSQPEFHIDDADAIRPEEEVSEEGPGRTDVSIGESSLFSAHPDVSDVSMGESSLFSAHPDMPIGESSMLPHDELPPKPPQPPRRPGSSAVL